MHCDDKSREELLAEAGELQRRVLELEGLYKKEHSLRKKQEKALLFDSLTSLPNRTLFFNHLKQSLSLSRRRRTHVAVLFFGIDRFKLINDTLGNDVGNLLLKQVARRLRKTLRSSDIVARPGRDEFMILLPDLPKGEDAGLTAERIFDALRPPFRLKGHLLHINAAIGISLYPGDGTTPDRLIRNAYTALLEARQTPAPQYHFYCDSFNAGAFDRLLMESSLRVALEKNQFTLHYQPLIDLRSGRITGLEALLRWDHPQIGSVSPGDFIPMLDDIGLISPLTEWILISACRQNKAFQDQGLPPVRMAVNLSPRQLHEEDLPQKIALILESTGLHPKYLELELTEEALVQNLDGTSRTLAALTEMGVHIAIDDFGTGYSSLSYLRHFPINRLKIDRSFVESITTDHNNAAISRAIIVLAHSLRLRVIAEGVETEEQLRFLESLECDEVQGYLFSRPVTAESIPQLLSRAPRVAGLHEDFRFRSGSGVTAVGSP
jgi:diguanylate cyclase (GGDEF)-like protein